MKTASNYNKIRGTKKNRKLKCIRIILHNITIICKKIGDAKQTLPLPKSYYSQTALA